MKISHQLFPDKFKVPENWTSLQTYKLFEKMGLAIFPKAGFPLFLPVGQILINSVNQIIRETAYQAGFSELYLPLVQTPNFIEETGRAEQFNQEFFYTCNNKLILAPTNEEVFVNLASKGINSYRQLPVRVFQIADKFRNIKKPKGIFRSKEFLMCDMISIDLNKEMLNDSAKIFEKIVEEVFQKLEIEAVRVTKHSDHYIEYLVECPEGDIYVSRNPDRYNPSGKHSSSVAMYFLFEQGGPFLSVADGTNRRSYVGTYGFGIQRCIHAIIEQHRDGRGISFPVSVRPFNSSVIIMDKNEPEQNKLAENCYNILLKSNAKPLFDDRADKTLKEKLDLADFYGIPVKIIIGKKEVANSTVTIKWRNGKTEEDSFASNILSTILENLQLKGT
jgi:prolyl-tRNA synthetase